MDGRMDGYIVKVILSRLGGTSHLVVFKAEVSIVDQVHLTAH